MIWIVVSVLIAETAGSDAVSPAPAVFIRMWPRPPLTEKFAVPPASDQFPPTGAAPQPFVTFRSNPSDANTVTGGGTAVVVVVVPVGGGVVVVVVVVGGGVVVVVVPVGGDVVEVLEVVDVVEVVVVAGGTVVVVVVVVVVGGGGLLLGVVVVRLSKLATRGALVEELER